MGLISSKKTSAGAKASSVDVGLAARPASPPRGLSAVLASNILTNDFRSYLADLDEEEGDSDEQTRVVWLNFVLSCRILKDMTEDVQEAARKGKKRLGSGGDHPSSSLRLQLQQMHHDYFSNDYRVSLDGQELWRACERATNQTENAKKVKLELLGPLWRAHDEVLAKLDELHHPFLAIQQERHLASQNSGSKIARALPDVIQQCIL